MYVSSMSEAGKMHYAAMGYANQVAQAQHQNVQATNQPRQGTTDRNSIAQDTLSLSEAAVKYQANTEAFGIKQQAVHANLNHQGIYTGAGRMTTFRYI